jgi:hypothetical protein
VAPLAPGTLGEQDQNTLVKQLLQATTHPIRADAKHLGGTSNTDPQGALLEISPIEGVAGH